MDHLVRGILGDGVRVVAALTTETCAEAARRHACESAAAVALGRACTSALLLATLTKGRERVTVQILGKGSLGGIAADANDAGEVRGYVRGRGVALPQHQGRPPLSALVGGGIVSVLRDLGMREPYRAALELSTGEIDEDLERYLTLSEQIESALTCDVVVDGSNVIAAAGVLVQCLPGGDAGVVAAARERMRDGGLYDFLSRRAADPEELARFASESEPAFLEARPVRFRCPCSRERVITALALCGVEELESMRREDGGAEVTCDFCSERYFVDAADLGKLLQQRSEA